MTAKLSKRKTRPPASGRSTRRRASTATRTAPLPIVGIGASAGGLEAFVELLKHLPVDTGMAFVLVQHLDPQHESALTEILSRATQMQVSEVANNRRVEPNCVYVIPPNTSLSISRGVLKLQPRKPVRTPHHSIDIFFESLALDQGSSAIGVILSGSANDGTMGLQAIKGEGGVTFAQDESARHDSMPCSAIAEGCVDFVLSPKAIAQELTRIARHPYVSAAAGHAAIGPQERATAQARAMGRAATHALSTGAVAGLGGTMRETRNDPFDPDFSRILMLLLKHSGVDFSLYKSTTIRRRLARRVVLSKHRNMADYATALRGNAKELDALYADMLIGVTSFFRNPEAFDVVKAKIFTKRLQHRSEEPYRIWVLGCSTGQEAYSLAMAYLECMDQAPHLRKLQIFATDLSESVLERARQGFYPKALMQDVSPERLRRFFVEDSGGYRVVKSLRELVVFARHNLILDPPFSRMDLISCRNLMIYLEPALQQKAIPTFHYALNPDGVLFLGASESVGSFTQMFAPVDKKQKIYVRKAARSPASLLPNRKQRDATGVPIRSALVKTHLMPVPRPQGPLPELSAQREADRIAVGQYAPPAVLINGELQILQFRGATGAYLEPPTGKASFDVLKMARAGLVQPLRTLINKAKKDGKVARKRNVRVQQGRSSVLVHLELIPLKNLRESVFLINFEDAEKAALPVAVAPSVGRKPVRADTRQESRRVATLEAELEETRDYMQSIQEQYEATNEELQASSEEVQSANEELQSLNEELETSKEELESANEELTTVNDEMSARNRELSNLNSDLTNLQASARLAIVVLNRDLTVRRFSAQAASLFELSASDIGRPIGHVRNSLDLGLALEPFIAGVIADVRERERETRDQQGRWYSLRVHPYFTADNRIDGAVLVFVDIDAQKHTEQTIGVARDYAESIIHTVRDPLLILHADLHVHRANEAFYSRFHISPSRAQGQLVYEMDNGQWNIPDLRKLLEEVLPRERSSEHFEICHTFGKRGQRNLLINARLLKNEHGEPYEIVLGIEDVTERVTAEAALRDRSAHFEAILNHAPLGVFMVDADFRVCEANPIARAVANDRPDLIGTDFSVLMHRMWTPGYADEVVRRFRHTLETGESHTDANRLESRADRGVDERYAWQVHRIPRPGGEFGVVCYFRDIAAQDSQATL